MFCSLSQSASHQDVLGHLRRQLNSNLQQLAACLGKGIDDCVLLLHQLLKYIRQIEVICSYRWPHERLLFQSSAYPTM